MTYSTRVSDLKLSSEMHDLVRRRTAPFLDRIGITQSLEHLLAEAYLQGMQDAVQACAALSPEIHHIATDRPRG